MSTRINNIKENNSKYYQAEVYFNENADVKENVLAYTLIFGLIGLVEELYFLPEDIIDNSETAIEIRKNGLSIFLRTKMDYEQLEAHLEKFMFLKKIMLNEIDESVFEPFASVPKNVQPVEPEPIIIQKNIELRQCYCQISQNEPCRIKQIQECQSGRDVF